MTLDKKFLNNRLEYQYNILSGDFKIFTQYSPYAKGVGAMCGLDTSRTRTLMNRVYSNTKKGDTVIDIGAGLGTLGVAALVKGASFVYFLDADLSEFPYTSFIEQELTPSKWADKFTVISADVSQGWKMPEDTYIDNVICTLFNTGPLLKLQSATIDHLFKQGWVDSHTRFNPSGTRFSVQLYDIDDEPITTASYLGSTCFYENPTHIKGNATITATKDGIAQYGRVIPTLLFPNKTTIQSDSIFKPRKAKLTGVLDGIQIQKGQVINIGFEYNLRKDEEVAVIPYD